MKKIIFMDVDGIFNCKTTVNRYNGVIGIDPFLVSIFNRIIFETDADIVLSSAWRFSADGKDEIRSRVMDFIDITPYCDSGFRGDEIKEWIKNNRDKVDRYAILDDDSDFYPEQHLFKTSWETGITKEIADAVIEHLNKK